MRATKNIYMVMFTLILIPITGFSQSSALRVGFGACSIGLGDSPYEDAGTYLRPEIGMAFGTIGSGNSGISTEIILSFRGVKYNYSQRIVNDSSLSYLIEKNYKVKLTYLEMPILWKRSITEKINMELGITAGLLFGAKRDGSTTITNDYAGSIDQTTEYSETGRYSNKEIFPDGIEKKRPLNYYDFGLNLGGNYDLGGIQVGLRYYYGLVDVIKNDYPVKNHSINNNNNSSLRVTCTIPFD